MESAEGATSEMSSGSKPEILEDMTATIRNAVNKALLHHKALGNKVPYWSNNRIVVEVPKITQVQDIGKNINKSK
jgi:hypothetical protein